MELTETEGQKDKLKGPNPIIPHLPHHHSDRGDKKVTSIQLYQAVDWQDQDIQKVF